MKKKLFLALTLVLLAGIIASGTAYAVTHQAVKGAKLIGVAMCGRNPMPTEATDDFFIVQYVDTQIKITNPNCSKSVTVPYLAILREDGTVVHEGTPKQWNDNGWVGSPDPNPVPEELGPHQIWQCAIVYLLNGAPTVPNETFPMFTVEITWSGAVDRPLIGTLMVHAMSGYFDGFVPGTPFEDQAKSIQQMATETSMESFSR
jgi:hypothetical protein